MTTGSDQVSVSLSPVSSNRDPQDDLDPEQTRNWADAFDAVIAAEGPARAAFLLRTLLDRAGAHSIPMPPVLNTPYWNTIGPAAEVGFPGDLDIESKISAAVRWNALAMVVRANRESAELGGHIATYASIADLFEVGFNHFFRAASSGNGNGASNPHSGDLVFFQPHASPGVYARAFLEGRLTEERLANFRRESGGYVQSGSRAQPSAGLSSYCHPWLMPDFWQFPTGSMGLGPIQAIYQARFMRYLEHRGIIDTSGRKVWTFVGDGEMEEPESLAGLSLAAREGLDNLIFVVNCNLQRLDGPVRGNGSIIQELEGLFAGAGWNVIKVLWSSDWDPLFARDTEGIILKRLHETVDGEFQRYAATDGRFNRERFFDKYPELQALVADLSDDDIDRLRRGGHDPVKIYAAYHAAAAHKGQPTVILAQTKKGYGMGEWGEGRMGAHQQKNLEAEALLAFRDRFALPLGDAEVLDLAFYQLPEGSPESRYLHERRAALGGYLPARSSEAPRLAVPAMASFARVLEGTNGREQSTTMAFGQLLQQLLRDPNIGRYVVPIVADEARTFGLHTLFRAAGIYSPRGQLYEPEDMGALVYYREATDGQILEEGICESGALSSWIAAATSYSTHGVPMLPLYIFYSVFGFQRVADLIWAAADQRARGFLFGATAGRTTLSGEGLQHQDGTSQLWASTIATCRAYDPCFGYELATIMQDGIRRMLHAQEDVFYYITTMNENYAHPAMPENTADGIIRGMYLLEERERADVQLLGSGTILREVLAAAEILEREHGVAANVWSVTSWSELRWDGMLASGRASAAVQEARGAPDGGAKSWVAQCLDTRAGPIVAATDYVSAVPDLIRPFIPRGRDYIALGTDGFGRSDKRANLRAFFAVDRQTIVRAALEHVTR